MKKQSAFTLIELSISLTVIAILMVGLMQGRSIVNQAKIRAAQQQTAQSPVLAISDLAVWYESISDKSFSSSEATNSSTVSTWYDINSQGLVALNATQSTGAKKPIYTTRAINGLPALKFDGSATYLETAYNPDLNPSKITIFAVVQTSAATTYGSVVSSRDDTPQRGYMIYAAPNSPVNYEAWFGNGVSTWAGNTVTSAIALSVPTILSVTNTGTTMSLYKNGTSVGSTSATMAQNTAQKLLIGAGKNEDVSPDYYYNGYIGELIIFKRYLKTEERKSVEKYLSRKWGIAVS